jgi:hypothetical protein
MSITKATATNVHPKKPTQIHAAKDLRDADESGMNALLKLGYRDIGLIR